MRSPPAPEDALARGLGDVGTGSDREDAGDQSLGAFARGREAGLAVERPKETQFDERAGLAYVRPLVIRGSTSRISGFPISIFPNSGWRGFRM